MPTKPLILVLNCGSSSVKFSLFDTDETGELLEIQSGLAERLGQPEAQLKLRAKKETDTLEIAEADHERAITTILDRLRDDGLFERIVGIGHRVVHGGEFFSGPTTIDDDVLNQIESCNRLAPLHNPANVVGIQLTQKMLPGKPNVAVFDTAFHQTLPASAYRYAVPNSWYTDLGVRKYGFHGTSHQYVSSVAAQQLDLQTAGVLTAHLGNGCSAAAVVNGTSVDTSMGLTPLDGLVMGTRSGSVDPGLHQYVATQLGIDVAAVTASLNAESGLLGLSEVSNDMRTLIEAEGDGDVNASLAIEVFCYRLAKELAGLTVALPHLDVLAFTGGIGENSSAIRKRTVDPLGVLGFEIDDVANSQNGSESNGFIHAASSVPILVVETAEEQMIAAQTLNTVAL